MQNKKTHINKFGKVFQYLREPSLRTSEVGDQIMEIKNALISGISFKGIQWINIRFIDCDFTGAYELNLDGMKNCLFEGCRFAGIFGFGLVANAHFNKIEARGETKLYTDKDSTGVIFESCDFRSIDSNSNHWGSLVMQGAARYINCYAKWFNLRGDERLEIDRCHIDDCRIAQGDVGSSAAVTITDTELSGITEMISSQMASLTVRNCTVGTLNLMDAQVAGDVRIEGIKGDRINLSVKSVGNVTVSNCTLANSSHDDFAFEIGAYSTNQLLLDRCNFGDGSVAIGPGGPLPDDQFKVGPRNRLTRLTHCTMGSLDASYSYGQSVMLDQCTVSTVDFSNSRIGNLQIQGSTIAQKLDLRNTRITTHSVKDLAPSKFRQVLLKGSSIKQIEGL